jgi:hypothetical protein
VAGNASVFSWNGYRGEIAVVGPLEKPIFFLHPVKIEIIENPLL